MLAVTVWHRVRHSAFSGRAKLQLYSITDDAVMSVTGQATISTHRGCKLRIARYPTFTYNPVSGGGSGKLLGPPTDGRQRVQFDTSVLNIPTVSWRNTRIAGIAPILGANIAITPTKLEGYVEEQTGRVQVGTQDVPGPNYCSGTLPATPALTHMVDCS